MRIPGSSRIQQTVRRVQKRLASSKGLILMYHRVAEVNIDPWSLCVTPQHFAEHLEVLQKHAHPISLQQLAQTHRDGNIPHRSVAITFDDGYADNLDRAKPLLERYGIPATVFVSTGYIDNEREFWWDELERLLLQPGKLPEQLDLNINESLCHWELGAAANYTERDYRSDRTAKADKASPGSRMSFYYSIWQALLPLSAGERRQMLDRICVWANADPAVRHNYRSLSLAELSLLGQGELVEIGAHTLTHPFLSSQSTVLQRDEIESSKAELERILHRPVTSFSYPFGDRSAETIELVKVSGFKCACSTQADVVWRQSDGFDLPRVTVENWDGSEFNRQLSMWFD